MNPHHHTTRHTAWRRTRTWVLAVTLLTVATGCAAPSQQPTIAPSTTSAAAPPATPVPTPEQMSPAEATVQLWSGISAGDPRAVRSAIELGADTESRNAQAQTPLILVTKANQIELARVLLEGGADPDAADAIQDSAFLYAGAEGLDEILALTIAHGAAVTSTNRFGGTALIPASEHAHVETVRILLDAGTPVDHINDLGWTAMHEAIVLGNGSDRHVEVVRMLLAAGANPYLADEQGVLPRELAAKRGLHSIVDVIDAYS